MSQDPIFIAILIVMVAVVVILAVGIFGFGIGGSFNARNGNRMMRWRLIGQAIAVAMILLFLWLRSG